jgi:hypothetical protein
MGSNSNYYDSQVRIDQTGEEQTIGSHIIF